MVNVTMLFHNRPILTMQALASMGLPQPRCSKDAQNVGWSKRPGMRQMNLTVCADGCTEESLDYIREHNTPAWTETELWMHNRPSKGTGASRNDVVAASEQRFGRGDYLYLSDNDVFFKSGWLETLTRCYDLAREQGYRVLGAYNHPFHQPIGGFYTADAYRVNEVHALALQSMLMTWDVWDKYGPFRETPPGKVCQGEDVDFSQKITADGFKLGVVSPALLVNTGITNSCGEKIPGWELVKAECPAGVLCE